MDENLPKSLNAISTPIPSENAGKKIIVFGTPTCPDCGRVKKFLTENAIEYEFHDVSSEKEANNWLTSFVTFVPVLVMPDKTLLYSPSNQELLEKINGGSVNEAVKMVELEVFDTIIIGAGPAGLSAAIYAVRKSLKVLIITKDIGGQAALSGDIENYLGFTMIAGADLVAKFKESVEQFKGDGIWIKDGVEVTDLVSENGQFVVKTLSGEYKSKSVIVASGRIPRHLNIPGEKEFIGKGVATCATCDAPLFKGKDVAVVGGGNSALDAAFSLMKLAKSVTIINLTEQISGDSILVENVTHANNVKILNNTESLEIIGKQFVEAVKVKEKITGKEEAIPVAGVFVEIGYTPSTGFDKLTDKDEQGCIIVDEMGHSSVDGIWAAGDVNNLWGEQIVIAAGEGAKVALSVAEHISKQPHQATSNPHEQV